jgi:hypothetical protein
MGKVFEMGAKKDLAQTPTEEASISPGDFSNPKQVQSSLPNLGWVSEGITDIVQRPVMGFYAGEVGPNGIANSYALGSHFLACSDIVENSFCTGNRFASTHD